MRQISRESSQFDMTAIGYYIAQPSEALPVRAEVSEVSVQSSAQPVTFLLEQR